MAYGNWDFHQALLHDLTVEIEIVCGDERKPGRFFQLYDGKIGGMGQYCGFQTDLRMPGRGWCGKGLLFSRWGSRDVSDAQVAPGGFIENSPHEEGFIGVRCPFEWTLGRYTCWLRPLSDDRIGRWYEFRVKRHADNVEATPGSLRFARVNGQSPLIDSGGGTWTELYGDSRYARYDEDVPPTILAIHQVLANAKSLPPHLCRTNYNVQFPAAEACVAPSGVLTLRSGKGVVRSSLPHDYKI